MAKPLAGKVCLVTGGTRGIGKGIALQLGKAGATVYVTGRTLNKPEAAVIGGSLEDTVSEIASRGGECVPVQCDHSKDADVVAVFDRIKRERDGQLDILVNNAYSAVNAIAKATGQPFWEQEDNMWDTVNNVGLRNHYMCTIQAARMMVPRKQGLIVNISSMGGLRYLFNVPYGIGKAAVDRMAADCAVELRRHKIAMVSLWPGAVKTETIEHMYSDDASSGLGKNQRAMKEMFDAGETPEYAGICIVKLAEDPNLLKKTGRILLTAEIGQEYGLKDINGRVITSPRSLGTVLYFGGWRKTAALIPSWVKMPYFMLTMYGSKF